MARSGDAAGYGRLSRCVGGWADAGRAALAQIMERVELDPATSEGRVHYLLPLGLGRKNAAEAAATLGMKPGYVLASPRRGRRIPDLRVARAFPIARNPRPGHP